HARRLRHHTRLRVARPRRSGNSCSGRGRRRPRQPGFAPARPRRGGHVMTVVDRVALPDDPHRLGQLRDAFAEATGRGAGGPVPKRVIAGYGFWIFLLSDFVLFSCFFAAYMVLRDASAGGPAESRLFDLNTVAAETACLLVSSFFSGMASLAAG